MKLKGIPLKGFKLKDGKVIKDEKAYDVATRLKRKTSKRVKVKRR